MVKISPSILSADFSDLSRTLIELEEAGADYIHLDVMDGRFVPNLTFGTKLIKDIRRYTSLPFDVHLMIEEPERYIAEFVAAGADIITIHLEATKHPHRALQMIKSLHKQAGISLVPSSNIGSLEYLLDLLDLVLVMSVNPGFGGQEFILSQSDKILHIKQLLQARKMEQQVLVEVDGGINQHTAKIAVQQGADILVAGSYIFASEFFQTNDRVKFLKERIDSLHF